MTMNVFRKKRSGFNAIELTVVVVIVFILLGVLLVALRSLTEVRVTGPDFMTTNNLKQIALACHSHQDAYKCLPPAFDRFGKMDFPASIHVHLLPFLEQANLYKIYLVQEGKGAEVTDAAIMTFITPEDNTVLNDAAGIQNSAANLRVFSDKGMATKYDANMAPLAGVEPGSAKIPTSFPDGTSNTIIFATKYGKCKEGGSRYAASPGSLFAAFFGENAALAPAHPSEPTAAFQSQPTANECVTTPLMAQSMSRRGILVALADGSVRIVHPNISPRTWNLVMQPNDGLKPGNDWD